MAELLIVVAIIGVLSGVAFVSVFNHMRALAQLERDTIAKEIFIAAQNHLTAIESQGYLHIDSDDYGVPVPPEKDEDDENTVAGQMDVYYYTVKGGASSYGTVLELMLPFGSVDETVRAGGNYIIRYQPSSATVLDVFYCPMIGRFSMENGFTASDYTSLMSESNYGESKSSARRNYNGAVVGWYGGEEPVPAGERLKNPTIEIINAERLQVKITDYNSDLAYASLKLIIKGDTSDAKKAITIRLEKIDQVDNRIAVESKGSAYTVTLDDITQSSLHFWQIEADDMGTEKQGFIPGENITIYAAAFSNNRLTNIARSIVGKTNSLFGYEEEETADETGSSANEAIVSNIRHLENLDIQVSKYGGTVFPGGAIQTSDLEWTEFLEAVKPIQEGNLNEKQAAITYFPSDTEDASTEEGTYKPVSPAVGLVYKGNNHVISGVVVDYAGDTGVFGELMDASSVSELLVLDAKISSSTENGNAGGLVGNLGAGTITGCAVGWSTVSGSGAAGGLIGKAGNGSSVTACYSAGHTEEGSYEKWIGPDETGTTKNSYDVTGVTAGGLIGISSATIVNSYSTCSVTGTTVGGLLGSGSGSVTKCYATGLVKGDTEGAFVGYYSGTSESITGCKYYMIINERHEGENGKEAFSYLDPIGGGTTSAGIIALDKDAEEYEKFVGMPSAWADAIPKDTSLLTYYQGRYPLQTVTRLGATVSKDDLVATHYGDWPAPEIFVINTGTGNGNSGNGNGGAGG